MRLYARCGTCNWAEYGGVIMKRAVSRTASNGMYEVLDPEVMHRKENKHFKE